MHLGTKKTQLRLKIPKNTRLECFKTTRITTHADTKTERREESFKISSIYKKLQDNFLKNNAYYSNNLEIHNYMQYEIQNSYSVSSLWKIVIFHLLFFSVVESVGPGVTEFSEGDHVLTLFTGECKTCRHCTSGKSNMCQVLGLERRGVMHSDQKTRFSIKGKPIYHYCAVSSFSEYTVVHSGCAVKVNLAVPLEKICLLSCGVAAGILACIIEFFPLDFFNRVEGFSMIHITSCHLQLCTCQE